MFYSYILKYVKNKSNNGTMSVLVTTEKTYRDIKCFLAFNDVSLFSVAV